ncbi:YVTN repeat-like/Quino protein amine dehydrogenase [Rhizopogon salebrosus TDB-379]|nr:YVTN repeat-like/Quino protein amine dehydrogenase [Rhizopogon salebrosus TDB-379]
MTSAQIKACEVDTGVVKILNKDRLPLGGLECIEISADNTLLTSGSTDGTVRIWNLDTGKFVAGPLGTNAGYVSAVRFSQDSKKLAVVSTYGNFPTAIYEFDASTLEPVGAPFEGHIKFISGVALSSDGALLASASGDNSIKFWAFESRRLLASFDVINPRTLILSPTISTQLAYATCSFGPDADYVIFICNIPLDILSNIGIAQGQSALPKVRIYSRPMQPAVLLECVATQQHRLSCLFPLGHKGPCLQETRSSPL